MNKRASTLIRKSITESTGLQGDELRRAIRVAKKSYIRSPRPGRFAIKTVLRSALK